MHQFAIAAERDALLRVSRLFLLYDEEVVESSHEVVSFFRGLSPVSLFKFGIVPYHGDDVDGPELFSHHLKELEPDGHEDSGA